MKWLPNLRDNPALGIRDFRILSGDAVCYALGTGGEQVVFGLLVLEIGGSSWWVGVAFALYYAPLMLLGVPAGAIADWLPRRLLLRIVQLAIALCLATVGILVGAGLVELWHLLAMTFVSGCVRAVYQPIRLSYAIDLVGPEHAAPALAFIQIGNRIGQGVGAIVAGVVMHRVGPEHAYMTLALGHVIGFALLAQLKKAGGTALHERTSLGRTFRDYGREIVRNHALLVLVLITAGVNIFGFSFSSALPELTTGRLAGGAEQLGVLYAARALGGTVAMAVFAFWGLQQRLHTLFVIVCFLFSVGLGALAFSSSTLSAIVALLLIAAMASLTDVLSQAMMQLCVADRLRGRAMGAWMFSVGVSPLGQLEMGALAAEFGVQSALIANAGALGVCAIVAALWLPRLFRQ